MLTPAQVRNPQFTRIRGGYKAIDVDDFMRDVAASYDQMFRENGELIKKIEILADQVEKYRKDEDNIRDALLAAQRTADQIVKEAHESVESQLANARTESKNLVNNASLKAEGILATAKEKSDRILADAKARSEDIISQKKDEIAHEEQSLQKMKREVSDFRSKIMSLYKQQVELISGLPAIEEKQEIREEPKEEIVEEPKEEIKEEVKEEPKPQPAVEAPKPAEPVKAEETVPPAAEEEQQEKVIEPKIIDEGAPLINTREEPAADENVPETAESETKEREKVYAGAGAPTDENQQAEKSETKFRDLLFGDDYDIFGKNDDNASSQKGFFRKK